MNEEILSRIKKIAERLKKEYKAERVILFGSYAKGEATDDSDVDIFIIAQAKERFFERCATVRKIVRDLSYGVPLSPIILNPQEVKKRLERGDQFVKQILEKGVDL
jgi:predicted nucleotidyltransferase